jgi:hypothetical protein
MKVGQVRVFKRRIPNRREVSKLKHPNLKTGDLIEFGLLSQLGQLTSDPCSGSLLAHRRSKHPNLVGAPSLSYMERHRWTASRDLSVAPATEPHSPRNTSRSGVFIAASARNSNELRCQNSECAAVLDVTASKYIFLCFLPVVRNLRVFSLSLDCALLMLLRLPI